jgi:hypothetical protein
MMKFLREIMDWWHDRPPNDDKHDFVEPPIVCGMDPAYPETVVLKIACKDGGEKYEVSKAINERFVAVIDERKMDIVPYRPPTLEEALEIVKEHYHVHAKASGTFEGQHRGRSFTAAPNASDAKLMAPRDLNQIIEELKRRFSPFLLVVIDRDLYAGAAHGWCNGSNWSADVIHELMRCAELNFRQELAKCGSGGGRSMPISGLDRPSLYPPRK